MHEEAVVRSKRMPSSRTIAIAPAIGYEEFRQRAWIASQEIRRANPNGVVLIRELRKALSGIPPASFTQHLLRLERNGLVYLIPPENADALTEDERRESLAHPSGDVRSFVLWMGPKTRPAYFWD
jgi:DNA-binding transcriptional ArsR family regulator